MAGETLTVTLTRPSATPVVGTIPADQLQTYGGPHTLTLGDGSRFRDYGRIQITPGAALTPEHPTTLARKEA